VGDKIEYIKTKKIDGDFINGPSSKPASAPAVADAPAPVDAAAQ
jgi:hypothetical protein